MDTLSLSLLVISVVLFTSIVVGAAFYLRRTIIARKNGFFSVNDLIRRKETMVARENQLDEAERKLAQERGEMFQRIADEQKALADEKRRIMQQQETQRLALERVASLSVQEAREQIIEQTRAMFAKERTELVSEEINATKLETQEKVAAILLPAMERLAETIARDHNVATIHLSGKDDDIKGKVIGKDGRNRASFERVTGTNLVIDKSDILTISSFNPVRREIARLTLEALLESRAIQPVKIEAQYEQTKKNFEAELIRFGKEAVERLKIYDLNPDLLSLIGSLKFRTSYGQDMMTHSTECALIAERIAADMGIDPYKAKKAAFLHDIGKARDFENSKNHVEEGIKIAREFDLEDYVMESIALHHSSSAGGSPFLYITKIADTLSASRPGARLDSSERYFERMVEIEKLGKTFKGVEEVYALQAGREIRIMVKPDQTTDETADEIALSFKNRLRERIQLHGKINITVIREYRKSELLE